MFLIRADLCYYAKYTHEILQIYVALYIFYITSSRSNIKAHQACQKINNFDSYVDSYRLFKLKVP